MNKIVLDAKAVKALGKLCGGTGGGKSIPIYDHPYYYLNIPGLIEVLTEVGMDVDQEVELSTIGSSNLYFNIGADINDGYQGLSLSVGTNDIDFTFAGESICYISHYDFDGAVSVRAILNQALVNHNENCTDCPENHILVTAVDGSYLPEYIGTYNFSILGSENYGRLTGDQMNKIFVKPDVYKVDLEKWLDAVDAIIPGFSDLTVGTYRHTSGGSSNFDILTTDHYKVTFVPADGSSNARIEAWSLTNTTGSGILFAVYGYITPNNETFRDFLLNITNYIYITECPSEITCFNNVIEGDGYGFNDSEVFIKAEEVAAQGGIQIPTTSFIEKI